jgi:hypothetical protein
MNNTRVFKMSFASVYPHYVQKAEKKGRTETEVKEIIFWLTGYDEKALKEIIEDKIDFETFLKKHLLLTPMFLRLRGNLRIQNRRNRRSFDAKNKISRQINRRISQRKSHGKILRT